ncbi:hypothetical protein EV284_0185 [Streptomyces sp. BK022]|nr:hypothetical protein EV284_0185 [Streptomyces sp. BK022]
MWVPDMCVPHVWAPDMCRPHTWLPHRWEAHMWADPAPQPSFRTTASDTAAAANPSTAPAATSPG